MSLAVDAYASEFAALFAPVPRVVTHIGQIIADLLDDPDPLEILVKALRLGSPSEFQEADTFEFYVLASGLTWPEVSGAETAPTTPGFSAVTLTLENMTFSSGSGTFTSIDPGYGESFAFRDGSDTVIDTAYISDGDTLADVAATISGTFSDVQVTCPTSGSIRFQIGYQEADDVQHEWDNNPGSPTETNLSDTAPSGGGDPVLLEYWEGGKTAKSYGLRRYLPNGDLIGNLCETSGGDIIRVTKHTLGEKLETGGLTTTAPKELLLSQALGRWLVVEPGETGDGLPIDRETALIVRVTGETVQFME